MSAPNIETSVGRAGSIRLSSGEVFTRVLAFLGIAYVLYAALDALDGEMGDGLKCAILECNNVRAPLSIFCWEHSKGHQ